MWGLKGSLAQGLIEKGSCLWQEAKGFWNEVRKPKKRLRRGRKGNKRVDAGTHAWFQGIWIGSESDWVWVSTEYWAVVCVNPRRKRKVVRVRKCAWLGISLFLCAPWTVLVSDPLLYILFFYGTNKCTVIYLGLWDIWDIDFIKI